jgi:hypothetical protein
MNYHRFTPNDQPSDNWLLHTVHNDEPSVRVREHYKELVCPKCRSFDEDAVFRAGFSQNAKLRVRGDLFESSEDLFCLSSKTVDALKKHNALNGLELKPIGATGWFVANISLRVEANASVYTPTRATCRQCGRPCSVTGSFQHLSEIECPSTERTWFTPKFDRQGYAGRDVFVTGDIVTILRSSGLKGGVFERLMNAEEETTFRQSLATGKPKRPPRLIIRL